ncbi:MAG: hypothetical protein BA863_10405 [Desulfovibrio sp. S3730MH75]|nr:MAG: hypothetical protein BA863_10405 [Desulfovibrio sp. S3730MH75]
MTHYVNCLDCGIKVEVKEDSSKLMHYCSRCHYVHRLEEENVALRKTQNWLRGWIEAEARCSRCDGLVRCKPDCSYISTGTLEVRKMEMTRKFLRSVDDIACADIACDDDGLEAVVVCDACGEESCLKGELMCENAKHAGTKTVYSKREMGGSEK